MQETPLHFKTISEVAGLIQTKQLSPVELAEAILGRIGSIDSRYKSYATVMADQAMASARAAETEITAGRYLGPLHGVPIAVKDLCFTKGVRTMGGTQVLRDHVPDFDATVVEKLQSAGAVILGKLNLTEGAMAGYNPEFQIPLNPWNTERWSGASSSGSGVATSAGMCFGSLGSDTGGSIRFPAAACGVVGIKPTYGLVSRYGLLAFGSSLDQIGPMTRSVADCADALNVISGHDHRDSTSVPAPFADFGQDLESGISGVNIGVPKEYLVEGIEPGVRSAFEASLKTLEDLGANVTETSLPLTDHALAVYYIIAPSEASANLSRYDGVKYGLGSTDSRTSAEATETARGKGFGEEVKRRIFLGTYALSAGYYDAYYKKAQRVRTLIRREFTDAFLKFDVLVTPTSPTVAFKIGDKMDDPFKMYMNDVCTIPVNIAGLPSISIPGGMSEGLPVGLQFIGPQFGDTAVIQAAAAYERATGWHLEHPLI
ncbi:MAG: Asp-tRNA(Asn)/Glu-tRNA(Gln) amidotransferase subunit GatA [Chloroflexi bacterium]|nr:Asp-tRNA(Asn)/Glu-tRNA(Gln) amidotransferase subunit GatA [Chloroflexota bacterium]